MSYESVRKEAGARFRADTDSGQMSENAKIRVLIAEDDDNARSLLVELLATLGHTVVSEVATGREAYESAKDVDSPKTTFAIPNAPTDGGSGRRRPRRRVARRAHA